MGFVVSFLAQDKTSLAQVKTSWGSLVSLLAHDQTPRAQFRSPRAQLKSLRGFVKSLLAQDETLWGTKVFRGVETIHVGNASGQVKVYVVRPVEGVVVSPGATHSQKLENIRRGER